PLPASTPSKSARTEVLGSASPKVAPSPPPLPSSAAGPHPALRGLEAPPMQVQTAVEARHPAPSPFKPVTHPPPGKSIANAATLPPPPLPAPLAQPPTPQPAAPAPPAGATLPNFPPVARAIADEDPAAFAEEHHADPAEVIALHHAEVSAASASSSSSSQGRD